jgi:succinoglycan biosynthesis protein ExoL
VSVLFLLPVASDPRFHKRIRGLQQAGLEARALYFERAYFAGHPLPCPAKSLGRISHGAYRSRLGRYLGAMRTLRRELRPGEAVHAFGLDLAVLALVGGFGRKFKLVYEIADVRSVQLARGIKGRVIRALERWVLNTARHVVVTAPGFASEYFRRYVGVEPRSLQVIENRLDLPASGRPAPGPARNADAPIVIGYFGVLRCPRSWETLKALARIAQGRVRVIVRGHAMGIDLKQETQQLAHVAYGGTFLAPDDLPGMYGAVDMVWGCYPAPPDQREGNWSWARTNRFYESCYFRKPLICLAGTDEARVVEASGLGIAVDISDPERAARELMAALPAGLPQWTRAAANVPDDWCVYSDEHQRLAAALRDCA